MSISHILSGSAPNGRVSRHEGIRLGLILGTTTWLWVALIDAVTGQPFHTFALFGGIAAFTAVHYLLNLLYGVVLVSVVRGAERVPSLIVGLVFCGIIFEGAFAMLTSLCSQALGSAAWLGLFGGSLISTTIALVLLTRAHPLGQYLRQAEDEL